ncbi:c-type cytochrome [Xanthobacteraceae bacterium Astr-EGSB]|uniref:c-type cytochrome n=1 Tax=Astrobacterium formosum TaxID=3069710 RepID=UPI0027B7DE09|nr:c-type cytochrome [Xanthobacteraceae bacterium Astr-EGSB]
MVLVVLSSVTMGAQGAWAQAAPTAFNMCKACHKIEPGKHGLGPSLAGVFGTKTGTNWPDFKYSDAHKKANLVWNDATLTKYLGNPKGTILGEKKAFAGLRNPDEVRAVVAYLKTLRK